jgi:integrase
LFAAWLAAGTPRWAPNTRAEYAYYVRLWEQAVSPKLPLQRLNPAGLQPVVNAHQQTPRTAQLVYHVLHAASALGVRWGWLPTNLADKLVRPAAPTRKRQWWTPEQCATFLAATEGTRWGPLWATALGTGLRNGELLALRWADIQWGRGLLRVERTAGWVAGQWQPKAPKTTSGHRTVALSDLATAALRRQRAQQAGWRLQAGAAWQDSGLVFTTRTGAPLRRFEVARALRSTLRGLALPAATLHSLRHLAASLALESGAPLPLVSRHLGHADVAITARVYSHALGDGAAVADALNSALGRDPTATRDSRDGADQGVL